MSGQAKEFHEEKYLLPGDVVDKNLGAYIGVLGHSMNEYPIPIPALVTGYDFNIIGGRALIPVIGVGRLGLEIYTLFGGVNPYPYITFGRNYYVSGSHTYAGAGIEYKRDGIFEIVRFELTKIGMRPVSDESEYEPKYVVTVGVGF